MKKKRKGKKPAARKREPQSGPQRAVFPPKINTRGVRATFAERVIEE